jgi:hypothetical protein
VGSGDLPDDNVGRDIVALDSEAGALAAGVPFKLLNTTLQCVFASVQSLAIALVLERDFSPAP